MNSAGRDDDRKPIRAGLRRGFGQSSNPRVLEPVHSLKGVASPLTGEASARVGAPIDSPTAMRELLCVHRNEQARLLLGASRLRCERTSLGRAFLSLRGEPCTESDWRREAAEELDACLLDGWEVPGALSDCVSRPRSAWISARGLARSAFALERTIAARMQLARAELCEGSIETALKMMEDLLALPLSEHREIDVLEALALACEACGRWDGATAYYAALSDRSEASPAVHAALLALALQAGDIPRADQARARLVESAAWLREDEIRRPDALSKLHARIQFQRAAGRWQYTDEAQRWIQEWCARMHQGSRTTRAVQRSPTARTPDQAMDGARSLQHARPVQESSARCGARGFRAQHGSEPHLHSEAMRSEPPRSEPHRALGASPSPPGPRASEGFGDLRSSWAADIALALL
jgi:hypothetical protein